MEKLISVIIPTYNRGDIILRSIESVLNQTYKNLEVIIADDCSTDKTKEVISKINDDRVKYICLNENKGAGGARNEGVKAATGELIAFHDSDDICKEDRLEKQVKYLQEHPEFDLVYSSYLIKQEDNEIIFPMNYSQEELEGNIYHFLLVRNTVGCPTILMKKEGFLNAGGFDESYRYLEDWDFIIRYAKDHMIGYINSPLITVMPLSNGLSSDIVNHCMTRSRMICNTKSELDKLNLFNIATTVFFQSAEKCGYLELAKKCLMNELLKSTIK